MPISIVILGTIAALWVVYALGRKVGRLEGYAVARAAAEAALDAQAVDVIARYMERELEAPLPGYVASQRQVGSEGRQ
jgi:hypothetical protein